MTPGAIVTRFIELIEARDLDAALVLVTDDCEYDNVPIGKVHGPDAMRATLGWLLDLSHAVEWRILHHVESGDDDSGVVMNERLDRFDLGDGSWMELPVAGVFVVEAGRISLWRDYFDQGTLMAQMPQV